jgi:hypothetical protein
VTFNTSAFPSSVVDITCEKKEGLELTGSKMFVSFAPPKFIVYEVIREINV